MRVALHSEIRAGLIEDYCAHHQAVPSDLLDLFARVGIRDWTIWRSGHRLFHLVECEDWEAALKGIETEPANLQWQKKIGPFIELFIDDEGEPGVSPLMEVWNLNAQLLSNPPCPR